MSRHPLKVLPGAAAAHGYRIGSRSIGGHRIGLKYYVSFKGQRISPYFPTAMGAASWLTERIAA